jgi:CRP-like cAMP-binding protein
LEAIKSNNDIFEKWVSLSNMENMINLSLSSAYLKQEFKSDFALKEYQEGDLIMQEGETPEEIFELISGSAVAIYNDEAVGRIKEGEVFGEISFLTERTRTATVQATRKSLVRVTGKDDFSDLIKHNPQVIIAISKTLASRIIELNEKISEQTPFMETRMEHSVPL